MQLILCITAEAAGVHVRQKEQLNTLLFSEFLLNILYFSLINIAHIPFFNHISYCCLQNVMNVENPEVGRFTKK